MKKTITLASAILAGWLVSVSQPVAACGSEFVLGDEVSAAHPASIGVAFALHDAVRAGSLPAMPGATGEEARLRADDTAHRLERSLASARSRLPPTALLLVESRLWTRYAPAASRQAHVHAGHEAGPVDGDVVVVTAESVLRGLLEGRIGWAQAVDAGLIVVVGEVPARTRVAAVLAARFARPGGAALAGNLPRDRF
ncbi:hypothetical protein K6V92_18210 [Cupriavidus respiraculi]|uniref:hypothetical protein n=1 Tax=Cupriavidus respiraculi TaxID=195930 RepID=UPI001C96C612|nr:hypothetical protein [Cupriavidus respiraculi]MBY4948551.1 hypothetical protein [Cupriavidus respiraculi]